MDDPIPRSWWVALLAALLTPTAGMLPGNTLLAAEELLDQAERRQAAARKLARGDAAGDAFVPGEE